MKTATVFNHAGGAGKTSIVRDVGYALAQAGHRVLLIDLDPQASLTKWLGVTNVTQEETVFPVAVEGKTLPDPREVFGMHLIPSMIGLSLAEPMISGQIGAVMTLSDALEEVREKYDIVLIDSPPSLGQLAALGALAADLLIVPVLTSQKGVDALPGLQQALAMYRRMKRDLSVGLYVPTMFESRRAHDQDVLAALQAQFDNLADPVPLRGAVWLDSTSAGQPVGVYAPNSLQHRDVLALSKKVAEVLGVNA